VGDIVFTMGVPETTNTSTHSNLQRKGKRKIAVRVCGTLGAAATELLFAVDRFRLHCDVMCD
jgi:hypothetical protein